MQVRRIPARERCSCRSNLENESAPRATFYGACELDVEVSPQMANTANTAIVTGASRGTGAGLVEAFLKRGYSVVANSRHITKACPFAAAANLALVDGDIGQPKTAAAIVDTAVSRFGRI